MQRKRIFIQSRTPICPRCFCEMNPETEQCEKCNYAYENETKIIYKEDFTC